MFKQVVSGKKIETPGVVNGITAGKLFHVAIVEVLHCIAQTGTGKEPAILRDCLRAQSKR